jgi:PTH1 family peptidyl-tRNA hydrolase
MTQKLPIRAIIGLGNPGAKYYHTRHSIGFRIVDALAHNYNGHWQKKNEMECTDITINDQHLLLIKPQTFMNDSGRVVPYLLKKGIKPEQILVVHDELEKPFGNISIKMGGSAKGHNGLRSIITACGADFPRLRFGIGRPQNKEQVPDYVLTNFSEDAHTLEQAIERAVNMIIDCM